MEIKGLAEYSALGKAEWFPILGSFVGLARLIYKLFDSLLPKTKDEIELDSLRGRVHFWSEEKRGALALIPIIGNALLIWHDFSTITRLDQLEYALERADNDQVIKAIFKKIPKEIRKSEIRMLDLIKINPKILQYSPFRHNRSFMEKAAIQNIDNLKYATELMKDRSFVFKIAEELTYTYQRDLIKKKLLDTRYGFTFFNGFTFFEGSRYLYDNGDLMLYHRNEPNKKGSHEILKYAKDLCKDTNFLLEASKAYPYLNPAKYTQGNADKQEFILEMMRIYKDPNIKKTLYSTDIESLPPGAAGNINAIISSYYQGKRFTIVEKAPDRAPTIPLKEIASAELKNNQEFMKEAIRIDKKSIEFASEELKPVL